MELTVTLKKEEWEFILEVIDMVEKPMIKSIAISLIKPPLDKQFEELNKKQLDGDQF